MKKLGAQIGRVAKAIAAGVTSAGGVLVAGLADSSPGADHLVSVEWKAAGILGAVSAITVYLVPNKAPVGE